MNILIIDDNPIFRKTYRADPWYLSSKGHRVTVLCPKPIKISRPLNDDTRVKFVFSYPFRSVESGKDLLNKFLYLAFNIIKIRDLIVKNNYDIIRAVGFLSAYSALATRGSNKLPVVSNL